MSKKAQIKKLRTIPGVGDRIAHHFLELGINRISDLKGRNPENLYAEMCEKKGCKIDRCMLYVFRCAVYYAENKIHEPAKLKWWNWKD